MDLQNTFCALCQKWEESERGWGTRPDGYSLHLSEDDRARFIQAYWDEMPAGVPYEYARPDGTPYWCSVGEEIYKKIKERRVGMRAYGTPPGGGGSDGRSPLSGGGHGRK